MVDAGASDAFWPHGYKWACWTLARCWPTTMSAWFEEPLRPDALEDFMACAASIRPVPIAGGEVLTRRQSFQPWLEAAAPSTSCSPT